MLVAAPRRDTNPIKRAGTTAEERGGRKGGGRHRSENRIRYIAKFMGCALEPRYRDLGDMIA